MKDLEKGFKELVELLQDAKINGDVKGFALIGGLAVSARARPRATKDIDFLIQADKNFYKKILTEYVYQHAYSMKTFKGDLLDPLQGVVRIYDENGLELIDLIPVFWNWQNEAIQEAENVNIFGNHVPVARVEDLIILKLKASGPQDLLDVEELLKATNPKLLNKERLFALAKRAHVDKKLTKFLSVT